MEHTILGSFIFNCTRVPTHMFESQLLQLINKVTKHSSSSCSGRWGGVWELHGDDKETKSFRAPDSRVHSAVCGLLCNCVAQFLASCSPYIALENPLRPGSTSRHTLFSARLRVTVISPVCWIISHFFLINKLMIV